MSEINFIEADPQRHCPVMVADLISKLCDMDVFPAGGFVRWMVSHRKKPFEYGDIDLWCENEEAFGPAKEFLTAECGEPVYDNWIGAMFRHKGERLQLIRPRQEGQIETHGEAHDLIAQFDFSVSMAAVATDDRGIIVHPSLIEDDLAGRLRIININCPVAILQRVAKYARRGWKLGVAESIKIFRSWDEVEDAVKADWLTKIDGLATAEADGRDEDWEMQYSELMKSMKYID